MQNMSDGLCAKRYLSDSTVSLRLLQRGTSTFEFPAAYKIHLFFQCLHQYLSFEIMAGAYEISCPDAQCEKEGVFSLVEIEKIVGKDLLEKHKSFRLNTGKCQQLEYHF